MQLHYNVLIIDDEKELANATKEYFEAFGISAMCLYSADEAENWLNSNKADIMLLDVNLGDKSGFDLCRNIRKASDVPILFISARIATDDILLGLNIGGDDYITKPYELSVLLAKVKARLLREEKAKSNINIGNLSFDLEKRIVFKNGIDLELKNKEFLLLSYFAQNANRILTKDEIFSAVWGDAFFSDGTLMVHVRKLREKIENDPENPKMLKTAHRAGYIFNSEK